MQVTFDGSDWAQNGVEERGKDIVSSTPGELSPELLQALHAIKSVRQYARGATLFEQGSVAVGVHIVLSGEVRVLLPTGQREAQLLSVMGAGKMLGLSESMTAEQYRTTAQAGDQTTTAFILREEFVGFLGQHGDFCLQVVRNLSEELHGLYHKFRNITAHPGRPRQRQLDEQ